MTVYWETSQRPLTIKTVWVKGHRHAILTEEDDLKKCNRKKDLCPITSERSIRLNANKRIIRFDRNDCTNTTDDSKYFADKTRNLEINSLSERVLQWLDLAGISMKYSEDRFAKTRQSLPEVKITQQEIKMFKKDIEFTIDTNKSEKIIEKDTNDNIRHDETPRDITDRNETCSVYTENSFYDSDEEDDEEDASSYEHVKNDDAFKDEYMNIIKKQIFENHCNTFAARKKLHIFIPSLPKKPDSSIDNDSNASNYSIKRTA